MVVTIHITFMLIIAIFGTELCRTDGAGEMFDMVFPFQSCNVGASEGTAARMAEEIETPKVVGFAERVLIWTFVRYRKEF
jgi:hypothetical protein